MFLLIFLFSEETDNRGTGERQQQSLSPNLTYPQSLNFTISSFLKRRVFLRNLPHSGRGIPVY
jgi:hypothetical protein